MNEENEEGVYMQIFKERVKEEMEDRDLDDQYEAAAMESFLLEARAVYDSQLYQDIKRQITKDYSGPLSEKEIDSLEYPSATAEEILTPFYERSKQLEEIVRNQISELEKAKYNGK